VTSFRTWKFKDCLVRLSPATQQTALRAYSYWKLDTKHPSLNFECIDDEEDVWSIRIGAHHRALCARKSGLVYIWFWIGTHEEYNRLV
jgi:hypothetical protein